MLKTEKAVSPHSSTLAWRIPWSLVGCSPWGPKESDMTARLHFHFSLSCIGEGNGNPLQRSCLENPRDGGSWWAAVYGVVESRTQLKQFSRSSSMLKKLAYLLGSLGSSASAQVFPRSRSACRCCVFDVFVRKKAPPPCSKSPSLLSSICQFYFMELTWVNCFFIGYFSSLVYLSEFCWFNVKRL